MTTMQAAKPHPLGQRIKAQRQRLGLSIAELARRAGVTRDTLAAWESGATTPRANRLLTLAGVLETSIAWLLEGDETGAPAPATTASTETAALREQLAQARELAQNLTTILDNLQTRLNDLDRTDEG